jgi:hypothetical protein
MRTHLLVALAACANTPRVPQGGPRGLRATDHLDAARDHDEQAKERDRWPATTAVAPGSTEVTPPIAWHRTWHTSDEHEQVARTHRSQADALQLAYEEACKNWPAARVTVSPLVRYGATGSNTEKGVVMYLGGDAGGPDQLLAELRCHRAWMMLSPQGMDSCPLDIPGLQVDAHGDAKGVTLYMSVEDPKWLPELQRRVAAEAEAGKHSH